MCGVIVVDAESFRSTNLGRDTYIMIISLDIIMIIWSSINCPTVIVHPSCAILMREATSETYGLGSTFPTYCFPIYLLPLFVFKSIIPKTQKYLVALYLPLLFCVLVRSIYPIYYNLIYLFTVERLTTSLTCQVASISSLCIGTIT